MTPTNPPIFNTGVAPTVSGLYQVDRGPTLGTPIRFYNADTKAWGVACPELQEAFDKRDIPSAIGALPWRGPFALTDKVEVTTNIVPLDKPAKTKPAPKATDAVDKAKAKAEKDAAKALKKAASAEAKAKAAEAKAKAKPPKAAPPASKAASKYPDGSVVFRAERGDWLGFMGGRQEAHRDTKEKVLAFFQKKYGITGKVVVDAPVATPVATPVAADSVTA